MIARRLPLAFTLAGVACFGGGDSPIGPFPDRVGGLAVDRIVAVGDGLLAGERDGALYRSAQETSIPALLASHVGHSEPAQPLISDPGVATGTASGGRLELVSAFPPTIERTPGTGAPIDPDRSAPYDNLAVPGARLTEVLTADSDATSVSGNRLYDIVLRGRGAAPIQAAELDPSLILVSLGTSDVLAFALVGGVPALAPGLPTPNGTFATIYEAVLDDLLDTGAQIVLFNIPDVVHLPVFNAVPPVAINSETGEPFTITIFDTVVDPVTGDTLTVQRQVPVPLLGPDGPLESDDRVTLDAEPLLELGVGVPTRQGGLGTALPDRVVLDADEQTLIRNATNGYNATIAALAAAHDLPVVDVRTLFDEFALGTLVSDGVRVSNEFVTGQAFSLDGFSLTAKGNGVLVNRMLAVLNARFGSRLPPVRTADLPGIPLLSQP